MPTKQLTDAQGKAILRNWPQRTQIWPPPDQVGYWIRAQPTSGPAASPRLSVPGATLFSTQPDGLWVYFKKGCCDVVVVEICGSVQNLNDKRSRYFPSSHSLILKCSKNWLLEAIQVQNGKRERWKAAGTLKKMPRSDRAIPVRHLRVLYALPNKLYRDWSRSHVPTGYELFCSHSSLDSFKSQKMQDFLRRMSIASQFYHA